MNDNDLISAYQEHSSAGWAHCGAWIARTQAAFAAWVTTYVILAIAAMSLGASHWIMWLMPIPVLVHVVAGIVFTKIEAKEFGEVEHD